MRASVLGVVLLACMCCGAAHAKSVSAGPSAEMLDFLGTYETSSGKDVDPMTLTGVVEPKKSPKKKAAVKTRTTKRKIKKKDGGYE